MKDGHGGLTIGSEMSAGVRNVFVENCRLNSPNLNEAFRFKTNAMRGGVIENAYFRKTSRSAKFLMPSCKVDFLLPGKARRGRSIRSCGISISAT